MVAKFHTKKSLWINYFHAKVVCLFYFCIFVKSMFANVNRLTKTTKNELDSILKSFGKQFSSIY